LPLIWKGTSSKNEVHGNDVLKEIRGGSTDENNSGSEEKEEEKAKTNLPDIPIKLIIKTGFDFCPALVSQTLELTASPKRDIASVKLSISRQMPGRPPVSLQKLYFGIRELGDEEFLADLVSSLQEDNDSDEEDTSFVLTLTLDAPPPPIDPKFALEEVFKEKLKGMTTDEIFDAYVANLVSMKYLDALLFSQSTQHNDHNHDNNQDRVSHVETQISSIPSLPQHIVMKKQALLLKQVLLSTLSQDTLQKIHGTGHDALQDTDPTRPRRPGVPGGAKITLRRTLQKNLNINWADTVRNFLLFLFFGHFGTRDEFTRALMIYGAPLCFLVQLRPVKIVWKQLFYALGKPPSILLSLLPAPQQVIMGCDADGFMRDIYGVGEGNGGTTHEDKGDYREVEDGEDYHEVEESEDYHEVEEEDYDELKDQEEHFGNFDHVQTNQSYDTDDDDYDSYDNED